MTHPDDGALLRHLDFELMGSESDEVIAHLSRCVSCNERLADIQNTMSFVANVLLRTDTSSRTRRQISFGRVIALAASVIVAVTVCFTPLRAWMVQRAQLLWNPSGDAELSSAPATLPLDAPQPAAGSVSFVSTNEVFVLELTSRQVAGSLTVSIGDGEMVTATMSGSPGDESLLVLPDRLRIVNSPASTTTYAVVLPPCVGRIDIIVANEKTVVLQPSDTRRMWTIPVQVP